MLELANHKQLLAQADKHMEAEVGKVKKDIEDNYAEKLNLEIVKMHAEYEKRYNKVVKMDSNNREQSLVELESTQRELKDLEIRYENFIKNYQEKLALSLIHI